MNAAPPPHTPTHAPPIGITFVVVLAFTKEGCAFPRHDAEQVEGFAQAEGLEMEIPLERRSIAFKHPNKEHLIQAVRKLKRFLEAVYGHGSLTLR